MDFTGEGVYIVYYRSTDMAGNVEPTKTKMFRLDGTPPDATVDLDGVEGTNGWYLSDVEVTINAWDVPSGLHWNARQKPAPITSEYLKRKDISSLRLFTIHRVSDRTHLYFVTKPSYLPGNVELSC